MKAQFTGDGEGRRVMKEPWTAGNQVSLRRTDTAARGSWRGVYGAHGYMMAGSDAKMPVYASVTPSGQTLTNWSPSTTDARALQNVAGTSRVAAAWTSTSSFTLDVTISDNRTHQLALYMMDWTSSGSQESVTIADGGTNAVLATQSVSQFSGGVYAVWSVSGHVKITVTAQGGTTAMVSGLFWDAAPGNTTYVYGAGGQLAAEYGSGPAGAGLQYLTADHLGSTRLVTAGATPTKRYDYWPFGEEMLAGIGGRPAAEYNAAVPTVAQPDPTTGMKFTGKERDAETGLDFFGARYYSGAQGRFTLPDPNNPTWNAQMLATGGLPAEAARAHMEGFLENPQNWNRYSYVRNNPLSFVDPFGAAPVGGYGQHLFTVRSQYTGLAKEFTNAIFSGGPNVEPNIGFSGPHREYNVAVEEVLQGLEQEFGAARNSWSLSQWREAATRTLNPSVPAIRNFLDTFNRNQGGKAIPALAAAIKAFRPSAGLIARSVIGGLGQDLLLLFRMQMLIMVNPSITNPEKRMQEEIKKEHKNCLVNRESGNCVY